MAAYSFSKKGSFNASRKEEVKVISVGMTVCVGM
jgi:hypothetical protein